MSDTRRVESDTRNDGKTMQALADTQGLPAPQRARFWLETLAAARYRGRHDTWTAARDRAAKDAGIKLTMAQRIWQRTDSMKSICGDTVIKLMLAYEELCRKNHEAAAAFKAERLELRNIDESDRKSD